MRSLRHAQGLNVYLDELTLQSSLMESELLKFDLDRLLRLFSWNGYDCEKPRLFKNLDVDWGPAYTENCTRWYSIQLTMNRITARNLGDIHRGLTVVLKRIFPYGQLVYGSFRLFTLRVKYDWPTQRTWTPSRFNTLLPLEHLPAIWRLLKFFEHLTIDSFRALKHVR